MEGRTGDRQEEEVGSWGERRGGDVFPITRFIGSISSCLKAAIQLPSYYTACTPTHMDQEPSLFCKSPL